LQRHKPPPLPAGQARRILGGILSKISPLVRRLFAWIVIQLQALPLHLHGTGLAVLRAGRWTWRRREHVLRPPVLIPLTLIGGRACWNAGFWPRSNGGGFLGGRRMVTDRSRRARLG
jgi:hypothetical protein